MVAQEFSKSTSTSFSEPLVDAKHKVILDFIISHAEGDQRPYLEVSVLNYPILGLLDSGATNTLVGQPGLEILLKLGLNLDTRKQVNCTVANGQTCFSKGVIRAPFCLMGKIHILEVLVVPQLPHTLILGTDFWLVMGIVPDLKRNVWHFSSNTPVESAVSVCGIQDKDNLTVEQRKTLNSLLEHKFKLFSTSLGYTNVIEHEIVTSSPPIKQRYYPVSPHKQKIIDQELTKMLEEGIIEPSKSGWSSPILLVPKRDGSYRFCVDYRALNAVTKKDAYPIPYVSAILDRLRDARYLSTLDVKSAFWQVSVKESSREFTAFTVPGRGLFQFKRMPFGLTNSPATWQRLLDSVLGADLEPYVLVYLDDIIVISPDFETHLEILSKVFDRLQAAGLTLSEDKCQFCRSSLKYLGYVVDSNGLRVDPEKVEAILNVPSPTNVHEVRRFLGMASWYRRFVPNFASIVAPLTRLTQKKVKFNWAQDSELAFNTIKDHLVSAPILTCPDFSRPFILQTDASAYGIGAVLTQRFDDEERVICFLSRSLTKQERVFSTTERECLSVIYAVEKLRHYLEGTHFTVITDHASLIWLNRLKDPTGRLARWALRLQPFDFTIVHRKGKENVVPDFLSRSVPVSVDAISSHPPHEFSSTTDQWYLGMLNKVNNKPDKYPQFRIENGILYKYVRCSIPELSSNSDYWKMVVPKDKRKDLIQAHHDDVRSGHVGIYKVYWKLYNWYIWPKMRSDVAKYIKSCRVCAAYKPEQKRPAGQMGKRPEITKPWQMISLDFVGPLPRSSHGNNHILVISDYFSKYVLTFPVRSASAKLLCRLVEDHIFLVYGVPQFLICDNGVQMRSKEFQKLCDNYRTKLSYTALYYPRADPCERVNKTVKTMISMYVKDNQRKWDDHLPAITCAIRTAKSETTGYSPYYVNFGREYVQTGDQYEYQLPNNDDINLDSMIQKRQLGFQKLYENVKQKLCVAQERNRKVYNLRRRPVHYQTGDKVWRKNKVHSDAVNFVNAKLCPKFVGPFVIKRKVGSWTYELADESDNLKGIWHVQDLKPFQDADIDLQ